MKRIIMGMAAIALLFTSCEKDQPENENQIVKITLSYFYIVLF